MFSPTLTGVGERSHLLNRDINLDTHITDVVNLFKWEDLDNVVLCGHSYGGWPVSGAVEIVRPKVSALVFVDAHLPEDGQQGSDISNGREEILAAADRDDISRRQKPAAYFRVNEKDRDWVDSKLTPQPIGVSLQPIRLTGARDSVLRKAYVRARDFPSDPFDNAFAKARDRGWRTYDVPGGHDVMIDEPELLARILVDVATGRD